jgi:hypothetical protein
MVRLGDFPRVFNRLQAPFGCNFNKETNQATRNVPKFGYSGQAHMSAYPAPQPDLPGLDKKTLKFSSWNPCSTTEGMPDRFGLK